jgi:hypothetical protein
MSKHNQQRMSLLGKPMKFRASRRDARIKKFQAMAYNFLERPSGKVALCYHAIVFCFVFMCLALSVFATIEEHEEEAGVMLYYLEIVIVIWFGLEFMIRLWSAGCRSRFQGWMGRLYFMKSPFCLIDVITICASLVVLTGLGGRVYAASALRGLRFFQILRMVRMDRRGGTWKLLGTVVYAHRQELVTTLYIGFLVLIFSSFVVYMVEKDYNENFSSFAHALWWGVITLCTVGYGDSVPVTWKGKIMASFCAICGISFFALPAGILGSGFALKVQQQQRQKHMNRRKVPAATLIQCLWRCYAADENSTSEATWHMHMVPLKRSAPFKSSIPNPSTFTSRLPTLRRKNTNSKSSPAKTSKGKGNTDTFESMSNVCEETDTTKVGGGSMKMGKRSLSRSSNLGRTRSLSPNPSRNPSIVPSRNTSQHPSPHSSKNQSRAPSPFPWNRVPSFNSTLPTAPDRLDSNDPALPLVLCSLLQREFAMKSPGRGRKSNLSRDEGDEEDEDEDYGPMSITLTSQHKGAIRTIRKLKYMAARRKFKEALRPYDVKDVIESYSAGHADLVVKVKGLQGRLDQILGKQGINKKDAYDSKVTLAARIVNTERQVDNIEEKLQFFINMYEEDRKRLNAMAYAVPHPPPSTPCPETPLSGHGVSPPHVNSPFINPMSPQLMYTSISQGLQKLTQPSKPRSILADHHAQGSSVVSSSPITCEEPPVKGTFKNGKKPFKKRVTLSYIPSRLDQVDSDEGTKNDDTTSLGSGHWSTSVGMAMAVSSTIVPPSVRIQGCTPPSEHDSLDGEIQKYFKEVSHF